MSSSESSSFLPFILISSVVVICGYIFITKMLTDNVSKANPKPRVEELTTAMSLRRSAQEDAVKTTENGATTPATQSSPANNITGSLQDQLKKKQQDKAEMIRHLQGPSGK